MTKRSAPMRRAFAVAGVAALTAVAGCGGGSDDAVDVQPEAGASPSTSLGADLEIVSDDGAGVVTRSRLTCEPPGGDHADPDAACAALARSGAASLPAVPEDRICTQVFGGPQTAKITGIWRGAPVSASLSRTNGCEISRWNGLRGLLPAVS